MQLGLHSRFNNLYILMSTLYMSLYLHLFVCTNTKCVPMTEVKKKTKRVVAAFSWVSQNHI